MTCRCGSAETVLRKMPHDRRIRCSCRECGRFLRWKRRTPGALERCEGVYGPPQLELEDLALPETGEEDGQARPAGLR